MPILEEDALMHGSQIPSKVSIKSPWHTWGFIQTPYVHITVNSSCNLTDLQHSGMHPRQLLSADQQTDQLDRLLDIRRQQCRVYGNEPKH